MPLPWRAVVLGDMVLGCASLEKRSCAPARSDVCSYSRSAHGSKGLARRGRDDVSSSGEEVEEEEEMDVPQTLKLKIGPPRGVRKERKKREEDRLPHPATPPASASNGSTAEPVVQQEAHQEAGAQTQTQIVGKEEGDTGEGDDRHLGVLGVGEGMDINIDGEPGEEGYEQFEQFGEEFEEFGDLDVDFDSLNLAYPDDETPSPIPPVPPLHAPATTNADTNWAGRGGETLNAGCNTDILMAFEHEGEELENGDDEGEEDLLMDLAYPEPLPLLQPHTPSCSLPSSSSTPTPTPDPDPTSPSPAKRKRKGKGNGWIKHKHPTGPRLQSACAESTAENMSYEEWCRSVMARVSTSQRRCRSDQGQGRRTEGGAGGWDGWDSAGARNGGGDALQGTGDVERKDGAECRPGGKESSVEAEGGGAAGVEGPRAGDHQKSAGAFKIRIKIPSGLSLKSLLPPLSSPQPNAEFPPFSSPSTTVSSAEVPAL